MSLKIKRQLAPQKAINTRTSGGGNPKRYITIHQTGNTAPGADAQVHANLQSRVNPRQASWHYSVDDKIAIQSFEDNIKCWHAGDGNGPGNTQSIGIEICINSDGDYRKAVENGAKLARILLDKYGLGDDRLRQHYDWSRKNCPAQIRANKDGISWADFKRMVAGEGMQSQPNKPSVSKPASKSISKMADEVIAGKHGDGHDNRRKSLGITQAEYNLVRDEVNSRLKGERKSPIPSIPRKSVSQMAQEVIDGKHGNGHANRRKSLSVSQAVYDEVKNEVNRRLNGGGKSVSKSASNAKSFRVDQKVTVKESASKFATGQSIASFVKGRTYKIAQVKSDRVLLDGIMSWVYKTDIY